MDDDFDVDGPLKTPIWKNPAVLGLLLVGGGAGGYVAWSQANPTAADLVSSGNVALSQEDLDRAEKQFRAALAHPEASPKHSLPHPDQ